MSAAETDSRRLRRRWGVGIFVVAITICAIYFLSPPTDLTPVGKPTNAITPSEPNNVNEDVFSNEEFVSRVRIYQPPEQMGPPNPFRVQPTDYVGAQACAECHKKRFEDFTETAHHHSSAFANKTTIMASFAEGKNEMQSVEPTLRFHMDAREDGFYQTAIQDLDGHRIENSQRIAVVTGSGKIGQTYLYATGPNLHQLPLSYFRSVDAWVHSPGFQDNRAYFARRVEADCLNCHATYYNSDVAPKQIGTPEHIILGISCERCHGGGSQHIAFHRQHPEEKHGRHIIHPATLPQQRQLDICGQCHSGDPVKYLKPPFSHRPGDALEEHYVLKALDARIKLGVHTNNQSARLSSSACFQQSEKMVCTTCHNPHVLERGNKRVFSQRCQQCHEVQACGVANELGTKIGENCIDCHLPSDPDLETPIALFNGEYVYPNIRDHAIAVYPELSRRIAKEVFKSDTSGLNSELPRDPRPED